MQDETLVWDGWKNVAHEARLFHRIREMIHEKFGINYESIEIAIKEFIVSEFPGVTEVVMEGMIVNKIYFSEPHYFSDFLLQFDLNFPEISY